VDVYKSEFLNNANLTLYKNVLDNKNLFINNNTFNLLSTTDNNFNGSFLNFNSLNLVETFLSLKKKNLLEDNKVQFFKKDFLFVGLSDEKTFKTNLFKRTQQLNGKKLKPFLSNQTQNLVKT